MAAYALSCLVLLHCGALLMRVLLLPVAAPCAAACETCAACSVCCAEALLIALSDAIEQQQIGLLGWRPS